MTLSTACGFSRSSKWFVLTNWHLGMVIMMKTRDNAITNIVSSKMRSHKNLVIEE